MPIIGAQDKRFLPKAVDGFAVSAHTPSVRRGCVAVLLGGLLLALAACATGTPCGSRKCGGPATEPRYTVRLALDGKPVPFAPSRRTPVKIGRPVRIDVYIDPPTDVPVSDVYLAVNSYPSGNDRGTPVGRLKILTHHVAAVARGEPVTAEWTPRPLFDTKQLDVSADFTIGDTGIQRVVGRLQLEP